jgi:hypothetical protein
MDNVQNCNKGKEKQNYLFAQLSTSYWGMDVQMPVFLTSALVGGEW